MQLLYCFAAVMAFRREMACVPASTEFGQPLAATITGAESLNSFAQDQVAQKPTPRSDDNSIHVAGGHRNKAAENQTDNDWDEAEQIMRCPAGF